MKKQTLKAVTMLVSIVALAFMTAAASSAQSSSHNLRANIPLTSLSAARRSQQANTLSDR
ncbi:MAG: hypothetical protein H0U54_15440 [Acidobacteria bacterium]|nr:hypothetical protein [Acidobacteriota bacterium]